MAATVGPSPPELPEAYKPIFQRLDKLFISGKYSDLRITCGDFGWDVHRMVVCSASDFFEKCCTNFKEAQTGIIDLPDDNRHAIDALLRYLYTADYDDEIAIADFAPILFNVHVHTNIPQTCRQIRAETLLYFYDLRLVNLMNRNPLDFLACREWLQCVPEAGWASIRSIRINQTHLSRSGHACNLHFELDLDKAEAPVTFWGDRRPQCGRCSDCLPIVDLILKDMCAGGLITGVGVDLVIGILEPLSPEA